MKNYNIYMIERDGAGMLLRDYLRDKLLLSHRSLVNIKKQQGITVNGAYAHVNIYLKEGDRLEISIQDEASENILPEMMELDIVYEDDYFIIINKPAGIPVHPTRKHFIGTLANGLVYYWMDRAVAIKIRPVIRLDKNTSGLILFAKNAHVQHLLSMKTGTTAFVKQYIAIVAGRLEADSGTIDAPILRENAKSLKRIVNEQGDRAVTHYKVVERFKETSLVDITLETGRTHQIRVHMCSIGHSLLGDDLYGGDTRLIARQALHANRIELQHPIDGRNMVFEAPLPTDLRQLIKILKNESEGR